MKLALLLATTALVFLSCATASPTADQLQKTVTDLLGAPTSPGIPDPQISVDPTAIRWTIFRNEVETTQSNSQGQSQQVLSPLPDTLLGINFGHGLFLDGQGNLSILPFQLWPEHWVTGQRYNAVVTTTLWAPNVVTKLGAVKDPAGFTTFRSGLFGIRQETTTWPSDEITAIGKKVHRNKDGSWWETNAIQLLETVHSYAKGDGEIKVTEHHFFDSTVSFTFDQSGVKTSNKSFSISVEQDHWKIVTGGDQWWFFVSNDKALIIRPRTGEYALMSQSAEGAQLVSSRGNKESLDVMTK